MGLFSKDPDTNNRRAETVTTAAKAIAKHAAGKDIDRDVDRLNELADEGRAARKDGGWW